MTADTVRTSKAERIILSFLTSTETYSVTRPEEVYDNIKNWMKQQAGGEEWMEETHTKAAWLLHIETVMIRCGYKQGAYWWSLPLLEAPHV